MRRPKDFIAGWIKLSERQKVEYPAALHRYLMRQLHNRDDAQDLAQEAYLRFLQLPNSGVVRKPGAYLFRIAFNLMTEWRLRQDRSVVSCDSELVESQEEVPAETPDLEDQLASRQRLEKVLEQVPVNYRQVLLMSKCDGMSNDEIAKVLNVAPDTVARYLGRAVAFARRAQWD